MTSDPITALRPGKPASATLWLVIATGGTIIAISMGIRQSFGLFLSPISADLGTGREVFSFTIALLNLLWGLTAPMAGAIADRWGPVWIVTAGAALYALGLVLMAMGGSEATLMTSGLLIGLGVSGTGFTAILGAVARAAPPSRRASALALASMGGSIGQFAALPYAHVLIGSLDWVSALMVLAVTALVMAPLGWAMAAGMRSDEGDATAAVHVGEGGPQAHAPAGEQRMGEAVRVAFSSMGFRLLTAGFFVCGFHVAFIQTHLPAYLSDRDFAPWVGAAALTIVGAANVLGTWLAGRVGEVVEKRLALTLLYLGRALLFVILLYVPMGQTGILVLAFGLGVLWLGTVPLTSGLVGTLFGAKWMSMLFGFVFLSHQLGAFAGVWLGGILYDATQSYDLMWQFSIALALLAALLHWPIRERAAMPVRPGHAR